LTLEILNDFYSVYQFDSDYKLDNIFQNNEFFSITRTKDELSVVAKEKSFDNFIKSETGWRILKITGILDFSLTGIISNISSILSEANISVFVISTFNTDYVMVKNETLEKTVEALRGNGYEVAGVSPN